jgi:hypothetical protein
MNIIGYRLLQETTTTKQKVNNVVFKDKIWIKSSMIEQLKEIDSFYSLETKVKCLITDIITCDIVDSNTIFDFTYYATDRPILILDNEDYYFELGCNVRRDVYVDSISIIYDNVLYTITIFTDAKLTFKIHKLKEDKINFHMIL